MTVLGARAFIYTQIHVIEGVNRETLNNFFKCLHTSSSNEGAVFCD